MKSRSPLSASDGVKARAPKAIGIKTKAKAVFHKAKAPQGQGQGYKSRPRPTSRHDEPTQYHFLWRKYLPVTNSVY